MCGRCGKADPQNQDQFPARESICHNCSMPGYFKSVCISTPKRSSIRRVETYSTNFLGTFHSSNMSAVETNEWTKSLNLNQQDILLKINTDTDVTVIPYGSKHEKSLQSAEFSLPKADQQPLEVQAQFMGHLRYNNLRTEQKILVIQGLSRLLLGSSKIEALATV